MDGSRGRALLNLREGASVLGLAVLVPIAIQVALGVVLWTAAQWGENWASFTNSTLSTPMTLLIILFINYVVLAVWWVWVSKSAGHSSSQGFLAALPVVGLIWALWLSSAVVRDNEPLALTRWPTKILLIVILSVSVILLPFSMLTATALSEREFQRLREPCFQTTEAVLAEDSIGSVGQNQIGLDQLNELTLEVVSLQDGAVARRDPTWSTHILNLLVWESLVEELAKASGVVVSTGQVEEAIVAGEIGAWGNSERSNISEANGIPPSMLYRYTCAALLSGALADHFPGDSLDGETSRIMQEWQSNAKRVGVHIDATQGYWNPEESLVQAAPWIATSPPVTSKPSIDSKRVFASQVTYSLDSIPSQQFPDSLGWQANLCVGTSDFTQAQYLNRVELFGRSGGSWIKVNDATASAKRGGRCGNGQVNLLIGTTAKEPPSNWTDKGWRTCQKYQIRLPETPAFRATSVDLCVATKATTSIEES